MSFESARPVAPRWLRGALFALILAAHALVFFRLSASVPVIPLPAIAIDFAPLPVAIEPPPAATPEPPASEAETAPPPVETVPPPVEETPPPPVQQAPAVEDIVPPLPPVAAPAPIPVVKTKPIPKPEPAKPRPKSKPETTPAPEPRRPAAARPAPARPSTPAATPSRPGSPAGAPSAAPAMSTAGYAALVAAELNRHKAYPEAARASGASGSVGVAFTIGPSGHATGIAVTSSSGNAALDSAARQAVASIRVPPPPGGLFRTATTIRFSLR